MAQEVKEEIPNNINFPRFETKRFNPDGTISVAGTTALTYPRFTEYINTILNVTDDDKGNDLNVPGYTHVDYRLWLLNIFTNVIDKEEKRVYLGSQPPRTIDNPALDDNTKKAFKKFYEDNKEKIEKIKTELTTDKVVNERLLESQKWKDIAKKKGELNKKEESKKEQEDEGISKKEEIEDEGISKKEEIEDEGASKKKEEDEEQKKISKNTNKNYMNNPLKLRITRKRKKKIPFKPPKRILIHCKKNKDNGQYECEKPAKIDIQENGIRSVSFLPVQIEKPTIVKNKNNPFTKIPDNNWLKSNVLENADYKKHIEIFNEHLGFLDKNKFFDFNFLDNLSFKEWHDNSIGKYSTESNPVSNKPFKKKGMKVDIYKKILWENLDQLNKDSIRINNKITNKTLVESKLKKIFENGIGENKFKIKNNNFYSSVFFILYFVISLEMSEYLYMWVQGEDSIYSSIVLFVDNIIIEHTKAEEKFDDEEFIYILYFLTRKIFYANYPIQQPNSSIEIDEDDINGISIHSIFNDNETHFTKKSDVLGYEYNNINLYNLRLQTVLLNIFLSIILKKHRDIFSNLWLCHKNFIKHIFFLLKRTLGLYFWNFGPKTNNLNDYYKNVGFFSTTDFKIVKNIYSNFLSSHSIIEFLTSLAIAFTTSLPHSNLTFNNIPWTDDVELAFKADIDFGSWPENKTLYDPKPYNYKPSAFFRRISLMINGQFDTSFITEKLEKTEDYDHNMYNSNVKEEILNKWKENKVNLLGWYNPEHWTYNEEAIEDYDIIIHFFNSNLFPELLKYYKDEFPVWNIIPDCPIWFIVEDNSMWNISFSSTWIKSPYILTDKEIKEKEEETKTATTAVEDDNEDEEEGKDDNEEEEEGKDDNEDEEEGKDDNEDEDEEEESQEENKQEDDEGKAEETKATDEPDEPEEPEEEEQKEEPDEGESEGEPDEGEEQKNLREFLESQEKSKEEKSCEADEQFKKLEKKADEEIKKDDRAAEEKFSKQTKDAIEKLETQIKSLKERPPDDTGKTENKIKWLESAKNTLINLEKCRIIRDDGLSESCDVVKRKSKKIRGQCSIMGGGKLSISEIADRRLKRIQKVLNNKRKRRTIKKSNRRLNKTIKLHQL